MTLPTIVTTYFGATDTRGSRIRVQMDHGEHKRTRWYSYSLCEDEAGNTGHTDMPHKAACRLFLRDLKAAGRRFVFDYLFVSSRLPDGKSVAHMQAIDKWNPAPADD